MENNNPKPFKMPPSPFQNLPFLSSFHQKKQQKTQRPSQLIYLLVHFPLFFRIFLGSQLFPAKSRLSSRKVRSHRGRSQHIDHAKCVLDQKKEAPPFLFFLLLLLLLLLLFLFSHVWQVVILLVSQGKKWHQWLVLGWNILQYGNPDARYVTVYIYTYLYRFQDCQIA